MGLDATVSTSATAGDTNRSNYDEAPACAMPSETHGFGEDSDVEINSPGILPHGRLDFGSLNFRDAPQVESPDPNRHVGEEALVPEARHEHRRKSEAGMQNFIQLQLVVILQPLIDRVGRLEGRVSPLEHSLRDVQRLVGLAQGQCDQQASAASALKAYTHDIDMRVQALKSAMDESKARIDGLKEDVEKNTENIETAKRRFESEAGSVPHVQRQVDALRATTTETAEALREKADALENALETNANDMTAALEGLRHNITTNADGLGRLVDRHGELHKFAHETRESSDKVKAVIPALQQRSDEIASREAHLRSQLNSWKDQWAKLHPEVQEAHREIAQIVKRCDHFDAAIHGAHQANIAHTGNLKEVRGYCERLRGDIVTLHAELVSTGQGVVKTQEDIDQVRRLANSTHGDLQEISRLTLKHVDDLNSLDRREVATVEKVHHNNEGLQELRMELSKQRAIAEGIQAGLDAARDEILGTRKIVAGTNSFLDGIKADMSKVKQTMYRLDHSVDFAHASLSGLQKGFSATGQHMQRRPSVKLPRVDDDSTRTPRPGTADQSTPRTSMATRPGSGA
mmetsp:Transcript_7468/g.21239  ORF Transcript_7468/g.21239 Transcript_7468/m.21239 type:complete len:573 (-) Transcript_7468:71-1789(-)